MTLPAVFTQPLPEVLARLRAAMLAAGDSAESPDQLDPEGDRLGDPDRGHRLCVGGRVSPRPALAETPEGASPETSPTAPTRKA